MRKKTMGWVGFLLVAGGVAGVTVLRRGGGDPAAATERRVAVVRGPLEVTVQATGEVSPLNRVEIQPPIAGRIEKLLVDEGDAVKEGQLLAWMSSSDRAAILDAARAQGAEALQRWQDTYRPTPIVAPLSGTVILRNVVVGQTVGTATVLFAMSDRLIVLAQVDEVDIGRVRVGMPARITLDAYPLETVAGRVFNVLREGKNVSNVITYGVKVAPDRALPAHYRSQMTANVTLRVSRKEDAVLVPAAAVRDNAAGEKVVRVPGPGGKPADRVVRTGLETPDAVEILAGVQPGDTVLIGNARYVPQPAAATSPLVMGGRGRGNGSRR